MSSAASEAPSRGREPPRLFLDSWAWVQGRKRAAALGRLDPWPCGRHGLALTVMAMPRGHYGECGDGRVPWLVPTMAARDLMVEALAARGTPTEQGALRAYRAAFDAQLQDAAQRGELAPGRLVYTVQARADAPRHLVPDGATLCCACSQARAAEGCCHRAWIAPFLVRAGWTVRLDGRPVMAGIP